MSTMTSYTHYIGWGDQLENDVLQVTPETTGSVSATTMTADTMTFIRSAALRSKNYVAAVTDALNDVRDSKHAPQC